MRLERSWGPRFVEELKVAKVCNFQPDNFAKVINEAELLAVADSRQQ